LPGGDKREMEFESLSLCLTRVLAAPLDYDAIR